MEKYYKLVEQNEIIGAVTQYDFMKYDTNMKCVVFATIETGQFVCYKDKYYRDNWLRALEGNVDVTHVSIQNITQQEYDILMQAFETEEIVPEEEQPEEEEPITEEETADNKDIEQIKKAKISELSKLCNKAIVDGFDVTLSDQKVHHFSLTTNDQLNLITLSTMLASGENQIPYHADGELCTFFSPADVNAILKGATALKTYHTTYYNSLKHYVDSLESLDDIGAVYYGMAVPDEFQSEVYQYLQD